MIPLPDSDEEDEEDEGEDQLAEQAEEVGRQPPAVDKKTLAMVRRKSANLADRSPAERGVAEPHTSGPSWMQVIYLGHIPFGFFEEEMKGFFSQFGAVTRLRLARSKKTGRSKGCVDHPLAADPHADTPSSSLNTRRWPRWWPR